MDNENSDSDTLSAEPYVEDHDMLDFEPGDELLPYHPGLDRLLSESCDLEQDGAKTPPSLAATCVFTDIPIKTEPIEPPFGEERVLIDLTEDTEKEPEMIEMVIPVQEAPDSEGTQAGTLGLASASPGGPLKKPTEQTQEKPQPKDANHPITTTATSSTAKPPSKKRKRRSEEHTSELQSHHDLVCRL